MTFIGRLLPWFVAKHFLKQIAASTQFEIGGEWLSAVRLEDAFFLVDLPTTGARRLLLFLGYLLPAGLVMRHRASFEFTVPSKESNQTRTLHAWHIDPNSVLVEYWSPTELAVVRARWAAEKAAYLAYRATQPDDEGWPSKADKARLAEQERVHQAEQRAAAGRAAAALRTSR